MSLSVELAKDEDPFVEVPGSMLDPSVKLKIPDGFERVPVGETIGPAFVYLQGGVSGMMPWTERNWCAAVPITVGSTISEQEVWIRFKE